MEYRAPFALHDAVLRFCHGASFVKVTFSIGRGDSVVGFLRGLFAQQGYPQSLLGAAFCSVRLLFDEVPLVAALQVDVTKLKNDDRLLPSVDSDFASASKLLVSSVGKQHFEHLETTFRGVRQEMYAAREEQTRILHDSHSLTMSQVALRGAEPSEELLADQRLQMSILEGKYVRELEGLADAQRAEFQEFVLRFAAIERETPVSQRLLDAAAAATRAAPPSFADLALPDSVELLTSFQLLLPGQSVVRKVSCVTCSAAALGRAALEMNGGGNDGGGGALVLAADLLAGSKAERSFCEAVDELPELLFETCSQQLRLCRAAAGLTEGDVLLTRHSNLPSVRLGLHLLLTMPSEHPPSLAQMRAKTRTVLASLRRSFAVCASLGCQTVSLPLAYDVEERSAPGDIDEAAFAERCAAILSLAQEFLPQFIHIRFYIPPKLSLAPELVKLVRTMKTSHVIKPV